MTCIVGFVNGDGKIWMGGDSLGCIRNCVTRRADEKVFIKDKMIYGFTSSFRMGQILRYSYSRPKHEEGMGDYEYLVSIYIPELIKCFKKEKWITIKDNEATGGTFLLGYNENLYQVDSDFQVAKSLEKYDACGSGYEYALGAMQALSRLKTGVGEPLKVKMALTAAAHFCPWVGEPFTVLSL